MRTSIATAAVFAVFAATLVAQMPEEKKPVPNDSVRVSIAGCTKGYVFTVGPRMPDISGGNNLSPGTHIRMNGPKKLITEITNYRSSMVSITGLMKRGQQRPGGVGIGGVQISPGPSGGISAGNSMPRQIEIDVEGWAPATGQCPSE